MRAQRQIMVERIIMPNLASSLARRSNAFRMQRLVVKAPAQHSVFVLPGADDVS